MFCSFNYSISFIIRPYRFILIRCIIIINISITIIISLLSFLSSCHARCPAYVCAGGGRPQPHFTLIDHLLVNKDAIERFCVVFVYNYTHI